MCLLILHTFNKPFAVSRYMLGCVNLSNFHFLFFFGTESLSCIQIFDLPNIRFSFEKFLIWCYSIVCLERCDIKQVCGVVRCLASEVLTSDRLMKKCQHPVYKRLIIPFRQHIRWGVYAVEMFEHSQSLSAVSPEIHISSLVQNVLA